MRYYYVALAALPLVFYARMENVSGPIFFIGCFIVNVFGCIIEPHVATSFMFNTYYSAAFTVMPAAIILFFRFETSPKCCGASGGSECAPETVAVGNSRSN